MGIYRDRFRETGKIACYLELSPLNCEVFMLRRIAEDRLRALWSAFPAVLVLGARQAGKTTLARTVLPEALYCDLEEPGTRELFSEDPTYQIESRE